MKYVDAGYQITVYPEVIQSELGDGKTFYRTVRGSYVLCRCVEGAVGNGAGTAAAGGAANGDNVAVLLPVPPMPEPSVLAGRTGVRWEERQWHYSDGWHSLISEYDASGNRIKKTEYDPDGSIIGYDVYDYDAMGNEIKWTTYGADGTTVTGLGFFEHDAQGNEVKYAHVNYDWSELGEYDHVAEVSEKEYDAFGNAVKRWDTEYKQDGTIFSEFAECMEGHDLNYSDGYDFLVKRIYTWYNADGTMRGSRVMKWEYDAAGRRISEIETVYDENGTMLGFRVFKDEYDAAGSHINGTVTYYDASGVPAKEGGDRMWELVEILNRDFT